MKKLILSFFTTLTLSSWGQETNLSGIYTEYKRTLWNNEDGSKYTFDQKPFVPMLQFDFNGGKVHIYNGNVESQGVYVVKDDTLITSVEFGSGKNMRTFHTKYIILESKDELVLREFKENLDKNYYLKKYHFKKSSAIQKNNTKVEYDIFTVVEEQPSYPGGMDAMKKFISEEAGKSTLKGNEKVFLKLLITPEGKVLTVDVLNTPRADYVEESLKIVRKLPDFIPGKQSGKPVYVYYNLPVKFN